MRNYALDPSAIRMLKYLFYLLKRKRRFSKLKLSNHAQYTVALVKGARRKWSGRGGQRLENAFSASSNDPYVERGLPEWSPS